MGVTTSLMTAAVTLCCVGTALAADPILPDPNLTPGQIFTTDADIVCASGFLQYVPPTPEKLKAFIFSEYGIDEHSGHYEINHLIPIALGGTDVPANLWPESFDTRPWNANLKNRLEDDLKERVCSGRMPLAEAQNALATDWITAYLVYLGDPTRAR